MAVPKKNVESKINKNVKTKGKKKKAPKKLEAPTKGIMKRTMKKKVKSKPKEVLMNQKVEDDSYKNLSSVEPMFTREIKEEIIEQVQTEIELEEKNIMLKIAKSVIISTLLTIFLFFIINMLVVIAWETSLPILILIWIVTTLLAYLFLTN